MITPLLSSASVKVSRLARVRTHRQLEEARKKDNCLWSKLVVASRKVGPKYCFFVRLSLKCWLKYWSFLYLSNRPIAHSHYFCNSRIKTKSFSLPKQRSESVAAAEIVEESNKTRPENLFSRSWKDWSFLTAWKGKGHNLARVTMETEQANHLPCIILIRTPKFLLCMWGCSDEKKGKRQRPPLLWLHPIQFL